MTALPVFDSQPSGRPYRYVQLQATGGAVLPGRLSGRDVLDWPMMIMCVGADQESCLAALDQVDARMIGWDPNPADLGMARVVRDDTYPPVIPFRSVEGDERFSITPTYRLSLDK